jgi:7-carboxy-7-deazaguanine synthase
LAYRVKEVFYSIQGEGYHSGRPTVFCRFSGCNLWSGKEKDRSNAKCSFCDTDFNNTDGDGGGIFKNAPKLVTHLLSFWPNTNPIRIEFTGGEPLLQLDQNLIDECKKNNIEITIETNGTQNVPDGIDWVCVSPKANVPIVVRKADELKIVYPQDGLDPKDFAAFKAKYYYLQAMDNDDLKENRDKTVEYCLNNQQWRLSLQIHKVLQIK